MRKASGFAMLAMLVFGVSAAYAVNFESSGWETFPVGDTGAAVYAVDMPKPDDWTEPLLGKYSSIDELVVTSPDPVHSGDKSLKLVDGGASGTPQAYIAWIENLQIGDTVTASMWCYDTTPSASPSGRLWGHFNANNDIDTYDGSPGVGSDYSDGTGWSYLEYTYTFLDDDYGTIGDRTGIVIEARTYSTTGDTIWIDDLEITAPDYAVICKPQLIPEPCTLLLFGMGGLALLRRR